MSLDNVNNSIESVIKCSKVLSMKVPVAEEKNSVAPLIVENNNNNHNSNSSKQGTNHLIYSIE